VSYYVDIDRICGSFNFISKYEFYLFLGAFDNFGLKPQDIPELLNISASGGLLEVGFHNAIYKFSCIKAKRLPFSIKVL
jgi:hypothetical protein